jgi:hypothetical protein
MPGLKAAVIIDRRLQQLRQSLYEKQACLLKGTPAMPASVAIVVAVVASSIVLIKYRLRHIWGLCRDLLLSSGAT